MENKLTRENFSVTQTLYKGSTEQSVELDCILPDYCPEIFKVLSLEISPCITKQSVEATRLCYDMVAAISLMYSSEDGEIFTLRQNLDYSKAVELSYPPKSPYISITPTVDSKSCRVINKRRVDIRGVIRVDILITQDGSDSAVSGGSGDGLQLKKEQFTYPVKRISKTRKVTVLEELELPSGVSEIKSVLRSSAVVTGCDRKVLSGKLLTKGEVFVTVDYTLSGSYPKTMTATLPFSQILDIEGLDERYEVCADASAVCCDVTFEGGKLMAGVDIEVKCIALRFASSELATDAFSTKYETEPIYTEVAVDGVPICLSESHKHRSTLSYSEGEISEVYFAGAYVKSVEAIKASEGITVKGKLCAYMFGKNDSGKTVYIEGSSDFEHKLGNTGEVLWICTGVISLSYNLLSANAVEISSELKLRGCIIPEKTERLISDIRFDYSSEKKENCEFALKLYFCTEGETPWEIAKRCSTSPDGIIKENGLEGCMAQCSGMLLIPYTN